MEGIIVKTHLIICYNFNYLISAFDRDVNLMSAGISKIDRINRIVECFTDRYLYKTINQITHPNLQGMRFETITNLHLIEDIETLQYIRSRYV